MATKKQIAAVAAAQKTVNKNIAAAQAAVAKASAAEAAATKAQPAGTVITNPLTAPYPTTSVADLNAANIAARKATEAWASPFSTAFGGTAPSTTLDYVRQYASPSSDVFGGTQSSALPYSPSAMVNPITGQPAGPIGGSQNPVVAPKVSEVSSIQKALDDLLAGTLTSYGIVDIAATIAKIRADYPDATSDQLLLLLKNDTRYNANYNARFSGNAMRKAAGLPTLDDATYLKAEKEYEKVMKAYGLDKTSLNTRKMYGTFIGNMMDIADVTGRVSLVYDNLKASPEIERSFRKFYPMLNQADIVAAFLNPEEQLPALQRKVQAAEIGGAALAQGLESNLTELTTPLGKESGTGYTNVTGGTIGAETIRAGGTTTAQAKAGYEKIAGELPQAEFLSSIYAKQGLAQYGQKEAEKARIQGLASEKRKLEELIKAEEASWSAKAGTTKVSLQGPRGGF